MPESNLSLSMKAFGPRPEALDALGARLLQHAAVRKVLGRAKHRLLSVELLDPPGDEKARRSPAKPDLFHRVLSMNRTALVLGGGLGGLVAAERLRKLLPASDRVIAVDRAVNHFFPLVIGITSGASLGTKSFNYGLPPEPRDDSQRCARRPGCPHRLERLRVSRSMNQASTRIEATSSKPSTKTCTNISG